MRMNMTAFKAEVRHRGKRMIAEKKRKRRHLMVVSATVTVCCLLFVVTVPWFGWFTSEMESKDSISQDEPTVGGNYFGSSFPAEPSEGKPNGSLQDAPTMPSPPGDGIGEMEGDGDTAARDIKSIAFVSSDSDKDSHIVSDSDQLASLYSDLLVPIYERTQSDAIYGCTIESGVGYRVTITTAKGENIEYIWDELYWYIVKDDLTVTLTESEKVTLLNLLLYNEAD